MVEGAPLLRLKVTCTSVNVSRFIIHKRGFIESSCKQLDQSWNEVKLLGLRRTLACDCHFLLFSILR